MKKTFCLLWAILILGIFCSAATAQEKKTPRLIVKNGVFDGGTVNEGEVIKHTFLISNQGDAPLQILNVKPG